MKSVIHLHDPAGVYTEAIARLDEAIAATPDPGERERLGHQRVAFDICNYPNVWIQTFNVDDLIAARSTEDTNHD